MLVLVSIHGGMGRSRRIEVDSDEQAMVRSDEGRWLPSEEGAELGDTKE